MIIETDYADGGLSPAQIEHLRHLEGYAPQWFLWGLPGSLGGDRKLPKNPAGGVGRVNDPSTAGTFSEALTAMHHKQAGGVGLLVSTAGAGFVGLDLDNVITDGVIHALGLEAIERFKGGYVEVSPSGRGLRIFCLGELPTGTPKGSTAIVDGVKFEAYPSGTNRFLRTTGALVKGTVGKVGHCQSALDWFAGVMIASKGQSPDNVNVQAANSAGSLNLDAVFDALSELRPDKDYEAVIEEIHGVISSQPRSKLAEAWRGNASPWKGDNSTADMFMASEAIRRGAGDVGDVVAVWGESGLGKRQKFLRKDYQRSTVEQAARSVLADLQKKGTVSSKANTPAPLPEGLAAGLGLSGDKLTYTRGGRLEASENTVVVLLRNDPALTGLLAFNELGQRTVRLKSWQVFDRGAADTPGPVTDDDVTRVGMYLLREWNLKIERKELGRGLEAAARDASFDPLADRLHELGGGWDGVRRVDSWLVDYLKVDADDCPEYTSTAGRIFLVGAVARALSPGCQLDTVLVLEGTGGAGKSTAFKALAEAVAPGLFTDAVSDVSNPVALVESTGGRWIVELSELSGIRRASDVEALKAALTRTTDTIRRPYAERPEELPRRFVFVASTNRSEYLADSSGALLRRFLPVRTLATETDPIDREALARDAGQLWGEAFRLYEAGAKWYLDESDGLAFTQWKAGRELRREEGAFHDELVTLLSDWVLDHLANEDGAGKRIGDIARAVGDMRTVEGDVAARNRLVESLRALGMQSIKRGGVKRWRFTPEAVRAALLVREQSSKNQLAAA